MSRRLPGIALVVAGAILSPAYVHADYIFGTSSGNGVIATDTTNTNSPYTTVIADSTDQIYGLAFGPSNNLYVVIRDTTGSQNTAHIEMYTRSGSGVGTFSDAGVYRSGLNYPTFGLSLVFDHNGNAFVTTGSGVTELKAGGGTASITGTGTSIPYQLAISGDTLYMTDLGNNKVFKSDLTQGSPSLSPFATLGSSEQSSGVATDAAGNVYVTTTSGKTVKYDSAGSALSDPFSNRGGSRTGLTFDNSNGNLYLVNAPNLYQIDGSGNSTPFTTNSNGGLVMPGVEYMTEAGAAVPEPSVFLLTGIGMGGLIVGYYWRRRALVPVESSKH